MSNAKESKRGGILVQKFMNWAGLQLRSFLKIPFPNLGNGSFDVLEEATVPFSCSLDLSFVF